MSLKSTKGPKGRLMIQALVILWAIMHGHHFVALALVLSLALA